MMRLTFSPAAIADIDGIWNYTAERWGADQADSYIDDIQTACEGLAADLRQGRPTNVLEGYFKYLVGRHVVFYRHQAETLIVIRILHQSMDADRHF